MLQRYSTTLAALLGLLALANTQACASATGTISGDREGEASGGQANSNGMPTAGSGSTSGGATGSGGSSAAIAGSANGASAAGAAGSASGGGSSASSASGASSAAGAPTTSFGQVTSLLDRRCAGSKCHSKGAAQLGFASATGSALHSMLTTPMPTATPHCAGVTLVAANDTNSPLLKIVASGGKIACTKPKAENIGPMPDKCTTTSTSATGQCLTASEIKTLSDWISAGAPQP
jgi:hypothetical protein